MPIETDRNVAVVQKDPRVGDPPVITYITSSGSVTMRYRGNEFRLPGPFLNESDARADAVSLARRLGWEENG